MNSYFTDVVGDEDSSYLYAVQLREHLNEIIYKGIAKSCDELCLDNYYAEVFYCGFKLKEE